MTPDGSPDNQPGHVSRKLDRGPVEAIRRAPRFRPFIAVEKQQRVLRDDQLLGSNAPARGTSPCAGPLLLIGRGPHHRIAARGRANRGALSTAGEERACSYVVAVELNHGSDLGSGRE